MPALSVPYKREMIYNLHGNRRYVDVATGSDTNEGSLEKPYATVQAAVTASVSKDVIYVAPGGFDEAVVIPRGLSKLRIVGWGGRGSTFLEPSTTNATALTNEADDVTIENIGCDGDGTGHAIVNRGRRFRAIGCKIEGGTDGCRLTLGTDAQITAGTHGKGDDLWLVDCEISSNTNGINLVPTDYGAVTQVRLRDCTFHDNTKDITETLGAGASAPVTFRDFDVGRCMFLRKEDGTEPTAYIDLNADNTNTGVVHGCTFPTALAGGKNTVSTGLIWTGNLHTDGISTGQPS